MNTYLIFTTEGRFQRIYAETCRSEQGELVFTTRRREVERVAENLVASVQVMEGGSWCGAVSVARTGSPKRVPVSAH